MAKVQIVQRSDDWKASFNGFWEAAPTAAQAYEALKRQPAVDVTGADIQVKGETVSARDAWTLAERF